MNRLRGIRYILFDLDGVLVDACEWHYESLNRALDKICNFTINREDHEKDFNGLPTKKKLEILNSRDLVEEKDFQKIWNFKQKITVDVIGENAKPDREKIDLHRQLDSLGIQTACVTNSITETAELMLTLTKQKAYLNFVITNEDVVTPKPDPEGYQAAMKRLGSSPGETLIIEDSEKGYLAAIETGARVLRVKNATEVTFENICQFLDPGVDQ